MDTPTRKTRAVIKDPERLITALLDISNLVGSVMRLDDILDRIVRITGDLVEVPVCSIYLFREDGRLVLRSNVGLESDLVGRAYFEPGEGIPGWVGREGQLVSLADVTQEERHRAMDSEIEAHCQAYLCAPLRIQDEIIGVMSACRMDRDEFTREQQRFFEIVCKQVAIVIEKSRMYDEKIQAEQLAAVAVSLSGLAHYIKNILFTSQIGEYLVDKGLNEWKDLDRVREGWKTLHEANQKIRKLVENMLSYSRKTQLEPKPMDLNRMITEIAESVHAQAAQRRVALRTELDPECSRVKLEPESIHDALLNLVTNAIDAIPEGRTGEIVLRTQRIPGQSNMRIEVADNGSGIAESHRDKVFHLFFSTKGKRGTGIGLAATKKIIEDHGGSVECHTVVGEGTRFVLYLPLVRPDDAHAI